MWIFRTDREKNTKNLIHNHHRQQAGMTQQDLAKAMGLSIATISELERGEKVRVPTYDKVLRFEQILKDADGELLEAAGYVRTNSGPIS